MPKKKRDDAQGGQGKARLSFEYGQCPKCELLLPLVPDCDDDDPVMGIRRFCRSCGSLRGGEGGLGLVSGWPSGQERAEETRTAQTRIYGA